MTVRYDMSNPRVSPSGRTKRPSENKCQVEAQAETDDRRHALRQVCSSVCRRQRETLRVRMARYIDTALFLSSAQFAILAGYTTIDIFRNDAEQRPSCTVRKQKDKEIDDHLCTADMSP